MVADTTQVATVESVISVICRPTLLRDRPSRLHVLREEPGGPVDMERKWIVNSSSLLPSSLVSNIIVDTLSAAAQETHATSHAPKATFTQVLSIQKHMAHFPMLHVELEASFILALPDVST